MSKADQRREAVLKLAVNVFGSQTAAETWLNEPLVALGGQNVYSACETESGYNEAIEILGRIENGDFS